MTRARKIFATASAVLAVLAMQPQRSAAGITDKAQVRAIVAPVLEIASASELTFGTFAVSRQAGSAELSPVSGLIRCNLAALGRNRSRPAALTISADPGQTFGIALSNVARVGRGPLQIEVSSFTHDAGTTPVVDFNGARQLRLGATLYVTGTVPGGRYRGNFEVIVTNN